MAHIIPKLFAAIFVAVTLSACSIIAHDYSYISSESTEWKENNNTYTFQCGEMEYSIRPEGTIDTLWASPLPIFPYVFPAFLLNKDTDTQFSRISITRRIGNNPDKELETIIPIIKLADNKMISPAFCDKWTQYKIKSGIQEYSTCRFNALVWDVPSYTVLFEGKMSSCQLPSLGLKQQIRKFYMACPPHCPRVYLE